MRNYSPAVKEQMFSDNHNFHSGGPLTRKRFEKGSPNQINSQVRSKFNEMS